MPQTQKTFTAKGFLKTLTILHFAMMIGPIVFLVVSYNQTEAGAFVLESSDSMFFYLIPVLLVASIFLGNLIGKKHYLEGQTKDTLQTKLAHYQTGSLIKYALIEGVALLSIIQMGNELNLYYLIFAVIALAYLLYIRPTKDKISTTMALSAQEVKAFDK